MNTTPAPTEPSLGASSPRWTFEELLPFFVATLGERAKLLSRPERNEADETADRRTSPEDSSDRPGYARHEQDQSRDPAEEALEGQLLPAELEEVEDRVDEARCPEQDAGDIVLGQVELVLAEELGLPRLVKDDYAYRTGHGHGVEQVDHVDDRPGHSGQRGPGRLLADRSQRQDRFDQSRIGVRADELERDRAGPSPEQRCREGPPGAEVQTWVGRPAAISTPEGAPP